MAVVKLSAIAAAGGAPASTDQVVGVTGGATDNLFTLAQIATSIGLSITAAKTLTVSNTLTLAGTDGKTLTVSNSLTLAGTDGKTLTVSNSLTLAGTDASTLNIGTGGTLGTAAYQNTGTSGANLPFLNGVNTWAAAQTHLFAPASNTQVDGIILSDTTAAPSSGNQQFSPSLHFIGQGWKTTATAGSQQVEWLIDLRPVNQTTSPNNHLFFSAQTNAGGFTKKFSMRVDGATAANNGLYLGDSGDAQILHLFSANDGSSNLGGTANRFGTAFLLTGLQGSADTFVIKIGASLDTFLTRGGAAATWQHGAADAAAPVAQTIRVQSVVAGTADTAGANWILKGSLSTGSGASGDIIFQTGGTGAGSTAQNTATTALTIKGATQAVNAVAAVTALSGTAIPAGGTAGKGLLLSSTANYGVFFGSGAPTLSAAKGSLYLRSDGTTTNDRAYINTDGGTTWTALTTAA